MADEADMARHFPDFGEVVAGYDERRAVRFGKSPDEPAHVDNPLRIKAVGRLVEDQELGTPSKARPMARRWRIPSE